MTIPIAIAGTDLSGIALGSVEVVAVSLGTTLLWSSAWSVSALFAGGEQGIWLDPSDFTTMFQDSAGTVPVTAVGQSVGKMLDKSGNNNHVSQSSGLKPILRQGSNGLYYLQTISSQTLVSAAFSIPSGQVTMSAGASYALDAGNGTIAGFGAFVTQTGSFDFGFNNRGLNAYHRADGAWGATYIQMVGKAPDVYTITVDNSGTTYTTEATRLRAGGWNHSNAAGIYTGGATNTGSGNFGTYGLKIMAGYASLTGNLYQLVLRSGVSTDAEIDALEKYIASKTVPFSAHYGFWIAPTAFNDSRTPIAQSGYSEMSTLAHVTVTTVAEYFEIEAYSNCLAIYGSWNEIGIYVNGVYDSSAYFPGNGVSKRRIALPAGLKTVAFVTGLQAKPSTLLTGVYIIAIRANAAMAETVTTTDNRILVYGDSISSGALETVGVPSKSAWAMLVRSAYAPNSLAVEAWGSRSLYDDCNTAGLRTSFVALLQQYSPSRIWMAIGTNDYGLNKWTAENFGTAYAATLDAIHAAMPSAIIYAQTPLLRTTETANGFGSTCGDYRAAIASAVSTRTTFTTLVDGTTFMTTASLTDGVHPTTAGHVLYANEVKTVLGIA